MTDMNLCELINTVQNLQICGHN